MEQLTELQHRLLSISCIYLEMKKREDVIEVDEEREMVRLERVTELPKI